MKRYALLILFALVSVFSSAQTLSPYATISLLTIAPGDELYSTFGHSGIRIKDPMEGIDLVYNYGAFNFSTQGFYIKFLRGTLPYKISLNYFDSELNGEGPYPGWNQEKRLVQEQVLNLSGKQKQGVADFLAKNYLPENREYAYKFFYDNCSSRLRDVLKTVCGDSLSFQSNVHADSSYRQWIDVYARKNNKLWADFGMDLAIGQPSDCLTGANGAMFLPDNLKDAFDKAKIKRNGVWQPLVSQKLNVNPEVLNDVVKKKELITPNILFWGLLVLISGLTFLQLKLENSNFLFDKILFTVTGIVGWVIVFLWFFYNQGVKVYNLYIIWAYTLLLPIALLIKKDTSRTWLAKHFLAYGIIQILLLLSWAFLPQEINYSLIPVVMMLAMRSFFVWWRLRNKLSTF